MGTEDADTWTKLGGLDMATPHAQKLNTLDDLVQKLRNQKLNAARMKRTAQELREEDEEKETT